MKRSVKKYLVCMAAMFLLLLGSSVTASASQDDNSLYDLGITTQGAVVSPEFKYDTWTYDVKVPSGTTLLELSPTPSSTAASIADISGTALDADGNATVYITVRSGNGAEFTYTLNVSTDPSLPSAAGETASAGTADAPADGAAADQTADQAAAAVQTPAPQPETQPATEPPTEPVTEDSRYVRVDKNAIQEAENTITRLKDEITQYRDTVSLYTKIMYGLIAAAIILLFIVINLILRKRDLKAELNDYRKMGYGGAVKKGKKKAPAPEAGSSQGAPQGRNGQNMQKGVPAGPQGAAQMPPQGTGQIPPQGHGAAPAQMRSAGGQPVNAGPYPPQPQYYPQGGQLDVMPQMSQRKGRMLPHYNEQGQPAPDPAAAVQGQQAAPPAAEQAGSVKQPASQQTAPAADAANSNRPVNAAQDNPAGNAAGGNPAADGQKKAVQANSDPAGMPAAEKPAPVKPEAASHAASEPEVTMIDL